MLKPVLIYLLVLLQLFLCVQAGGQDCSDTSFNVRLHTKTHFSILDQQTAQGSAIFYCGRIASISYARVMDGFLLKTSGDGNVLWSKRVWQSDSTNIAFSNLKELSDGSIFVLGSTCNQNQNCTSSKLITAKFSPAGNLLWLRSYTLPKLDTNDINLRTSEITENGGSIYFACNVPVPGYSVVAKLDTSGNLLWSTGCAYKINFANSGFSFVKPFVNKSTVSAPAAFSDAYGVAQFDSSTGGLIGFRRYPIVNQWWNVIGPSTSFPMKAKQLSNGNFMVGAWVQNGSGSGLASGSQFQALEFDSLFFVKRSFLVNAFPSKNTNRDFVIRENGDFLCYLYTVKSDRYYGVLNYGGNFSRQKKISFNATGYKEQLGASVLKSGSNLISLTQTYDNTVIGEYGLDNYTLTESNPLGNSCFYEQDTAFSSIVNFDVTTEQSSFDRVDQNALAERYFPVSVTEISFAKQEVCKKISTCDTLKIIGPSTFCFKGTQTFSVYKSRSCPKKIKWQIDPRAVRSLTEVNDTTISIVFQGEWSGYLYAGLEGCALKDSINLKVFDRVRKDFFGPDTSFCKGDSLLLRVPGSYQSYIWNNGTTASIMPVKSEGEYVVLALRFDGCYDTDTIHVLPLYNPPAFRLTSTNSLCIGQTDTLTPGSGYVNYLWQDGSRTEMMRVIAPGIYFVSVVDTHGCTRSDTAVITNLYYPPSRFMLRDTSMCSYETIQLKPLAAFSTYLWDNGMTTALLEIKHEGRYGLTVTDKNGCKGTEYTQVNYKECKNFIHFPSAFTPNLDGRNDLFRPSVSGVLAQYNLTVYNRWGGVVFSSKNWSEGWDGQLKGKAQENNVFVWLCSYQFFGKAAQIRKGTVMLIK